MYKEITANKRRSAVLVLFFVVFVAFVGWAFGEYLEIGYAGLVLALVVACLLTVFSYYQGDTVALWTAGAAPVTKEQAPELVRIVENLAITAGIPMPRVYVISDPALNAFATGRDPKHASVAVTAGLLERLEHSELESVLAHELSHIRNYDVRLMMLVLVLVGTVALLSHWFLRISFWGGGRGNRRNNGTAIIAIIGLLALILAPIIANLIKLAVSRKREFLADASGALLTRYPDGLANALKKIAADRQPLRRANEATAHLFFTNPFGGSHPRLRSLFSTHPPVEERIAALERMGRMA
ncbi:MAG: M48 family metallopeptidase [Candidatus Kerfeldbacteria bacterium]|nr:M48 family metallopeptidase [Candidatus Kerfeldbacteria bacterium]